MATAKKSPAKKTASKAPAKKKAAPAKKAAPKKSPAKKSGAARGGAFNAALTPSAELGAVIGTKPLPRTEVVKKMWEYIKANGLQDQKNKRMINSDDKLRAVFGGKKQVSMFEMTALVNKHLKS